MNRLIWFEAFGIELEDMLVDRDTLAVRPLADSLLGLLSGGRCVSDVQLGPITLSNELALHVIELKTTLPTCDLLGTVQQFRDTLNDLTPFLHCLNCRLLPSGMHPLMNPRTFLWPHDNYPIYQAYDRIFNCRSHGWANCRACT